MKVVHNTKVSSTTGRSDGKTLVKLSDGSEKTVDLYIDATGDKPVTGFLPKEWLGKGDYVVVDEPTLRVKGAKNVYAIGSVQSSGNGGVMDANNTIKPAAESIKMDLLGLGSSEQPPGELGWIAWLTSWLFPTTESGKRTHNYKPMTKDMQFVPIGKDAGVGVMMGYRAPQFMVKMIKAKAPGFFVDKAPGLVTGADYVKA